MKKRIICMLLTVIMIVNCIPFAIAASSAGYVISDKTVRAGEVFTLDLSIKDNPGIISLRFKINYDSSALELQSVSDAALLSGYTTPSPTVGSPYTLRWIDPLATSNNSSNGKVATLTFKALRQTNTEVSIEHVEARNINGTKVAFAAASSDIEIGAPYVYTSDINLDVNELSLEIGDSHTLTATVLPANATNKTVRWESSNYSVATVDQNGRVTAYKDGTAIITATDVGGHTDRCTVTVFCAHNIGNDWKSDTRYHWKECSKCFYKSDKQTHDFGDYVYNNDATLSYDGTKTRTCFTCGYEDTVPVSGTQLNPPTFDIWFSKSESRNDTVSTMSEGNRYYLFFRLYDEQTDTDWDEVMTNDYNVKVSIYGPSNEILYETNRQDDCFWVSRLYSKPGQYTYNVEVSGAFNFSQTRFFYIEEDPLNIYVYQNSIELSLESGGKASETIDVFYSGYHHAGLTFGRSQDGDSVKAVWKDQQQPKALPLEITALKAGKTIITVKLKDTDTGEVFDTVTITVNVIAPVDSSQMFTDVPKNAWYKSYVDYAVSNGIFGGKGAGKFEPNANITRAEFVQVLANITGADLSTYKSHTNFTDVKSNQWFSGAVNWAYEKGIVSGTGAGRFSPNANITREQMCVMIVNYARYRGISLTALKGTGIELPDIPTINRFEFSDDSKISSWAKTAVYTCQRAGLVNGKGGNMFDPQGNATRAEAAAVFTNFHKQYL